jgi:hypothetical protein
MKYRILIYYTALFAILPSLDTMAGAYNTFDPLEVVFGGSFYDVGGEWRIVAKKKYDDSSAILSELSVVFEGDELAVPKEVFKIKSPKIERIKFRYNDDSTLTAFFDSGKKNVEKLISLELRIPFGDAYECSATQWSMELFSYVKINFYIEENIDHKTEYYDSKTMCTSRKQYMHLEK